MVTLLQGDCRDMLDTLESESVQTIVTSPPYYGLRDYGVAGQIGLEDTPAAYVAVLVDVFRKARRVLRSDGTLWLNLGDSYSGSGKGGNPTEGKQATNKGSQSVGVLYGIGDTARAAAVTNVTRNVAGVLPKNLLGIPWRVAFALQDDGWYLRSDIIWSKPNPMPESVTDRPTRAHEYLFLFSKSPRYFYDADAIAEPVKQSSIDRINQPTFDEQTGGTKDYGEDSNRSQRKTLENFAKRSKGGGVRALSTEGAHTANPANREGRDMSQVGVGLTRNRRTVWTIATMPYADAHFATMPEALVEPCILAGSRAGDTVLDPFGGSGTVAKVAERYQRGAVLIDLNAEYIKLQEKRTDGVQVELFV